MRLWGNVLSGSACCLVGVGVHGRRVGVVWKGSSFSMRWSVCLGFRADGVQVPSGSPRGNCLQGG